MFGNTAELSERLYKQVRGLQITTDASLINLALMLSKPIRLLRLLSWLKTEFSVIAWNQKLNSGSLTTVGGDWMTVCINFEVKECFLVGPLRPKNVSIFRKYQLILSIRTLFNASLRAVHQPTSTFGNVTLFAVSTIKTECTFRLSLSWIFFVYH